MHVIIFEVFAVSRDSRYCFTRSHIDFFSFTIRAEICNVRFNESRKPSQRPIDVGGFPWTPIPIQLDSEPCLLCEQAYPFHLQENLILQTKQ